MAELIGSHKNLRGSPVLNSYGFNIFMSKRFAKIVKSWKKEKFFRDRVKTEKDMEMVDQWSVAYVPMYVENIKKFDKTEADKKAVEEFLRLPFSN